MKKSKFIKKVLKSFDNTVFTTPEQVEVAIDLFVKLGMLPPAHHKEPNERGFCKVDFIWEEETITNLVLIP